MIDLRVRAATDDDQGAIATLLASAWGDTHVVVHGTVFAADTLPALVAEADGTVVGLLTYDLSPDGLEVVTLDTPRRRRGVGTALLAAAQTTAQNAGLRRLWLVTTNDNLDALRFYQRRGLRISGVVPEAVDAARALKPAIPVVGEYGIELHDELTLELRW